MADYYYFIIEGYEQPFGYIRKSKVEQIVWPDYWKTNHDDKLITLNSGSGIEDRNGYLDKTLRQIHEKGEVSEPRKLFDEPYGIQGPDGKAVLIMNRSAAGMFGIRTYGVFLIAYIQTDGVRKFWVAQRSQKKMTYPGKLDMCVAGSHRAQEAPIASLREAYTRKWAHSCGAVTYQMSVYDSGKPASRAQTQYAYEIELPTDMAPKPCDGEVEEFKLMTLEEVRDSLFQRDFKLNIAMTWMD
ncbi:uncharacterized protein BDZ99DRAFT_507344 [Mytilinidion resinicola]|uniref:Nudix hydrolase domain-containing protein n=1 Tax=Mytilinidion resinicola TaxID=574789 RepID=A0A6A6YZA8_9PEZI|nr:uncharacterized protein BDZ99DRAFT_507344 [Mytilinidion resinicola]KAF2813344.1 hypothetical protein BDZ99DRAFT_507344 [Mytilinidion resinicola]